MHFVLGTKIYEMAMGTWHLGYIPHIKNPRTFNEKIMHRKVYRWQEVPPELTDKYAVRDFVAKTIGSEYLNELYCVYEHPEDINFANLPESFVVKATHGSQMNIIVKDRRSFDETAAREKCGRYLRQTYGRHFDELWYSAIPHRLIVEKLITDRTYGLPLDFKFFVFHGRAEFIQIDFDRFTNHTRSIFNRNWNQQEFSFLYPQGRAIDPPLLLPQMLEIAGRLGSEFDFVRVDLYSPDNKTILFGEMTFAPEAGWGHFIPMKQADFDIGRLWILANKG
jgi:hypothetical protein